MVVRIRQKEDGNQNILSAVSQAIPLAFHPLARPYLEKQLAAAVDLEILRKLSSLLGPACEKHFATQILDPRCRTDPGLLDLLRNLHSIERAGLFEARTWKS